MEELTLTTPALLFSAVSLILLAYTNRFLSYAQLVRQLRDRYMENPSDITEAQIENLRKRLNLTRRMQGLGIASLFFCVVSMFTTSSFWRARVWISRRIKSIAKYPKITFPSNIGYRMVKTDYNISSESP